VSQLRLFSLIFVSHAVDVIKACHLDVIQLFADIARQVADEFFIFQSVSQCFSSLGARHIDLPKRQTHSDFARFVTTKQS